MPSDYWKIGKQHFICSNLALFIVPIFLSFLSSLFLFFSFSSGATATPATSNDAPEQYAYIRLFTAILHMLWKYDKYDIVNCDNNNMDNYITGVITYLPAQFDPLGPLGPYPVAQAVQVAWFAGSQVAQLSTEHRTVELNDTTGISPAIQNS